MPYPGGGPTRAAVRNPGGAADNTKPFPPPLKPTPVRPPTDVALGFRHLPDLGLEFCLVGKETEDERLLSGRLIR